MWTRFADTLRCPACKGTLVLEAFSRSSVPVGADYEDLARQRGIFSARFAEQIETGLLLCAPCKAMFPIVEGLPVLLCYSTPVHEQFLARHRGRGLERFASYQFLAAEPPSGERAVMK